MDSPRFRWPTPNEDDQSQGDRDAWAVRIQTNLIMSEALISAACRNVRPASSAGRGLKQ